MTTVSDYDTVVLFRERIDTNLRKWLFGEPKQTHRHDWKPIRAIGDPWYTKSTYAGHATNHGMKITIIYQCKECSNVDAVLEEKWGFGSKHAAMKWYEAVSKSLGLVKTGRNEDEVKNSDV